MAKGSRFRWIPWISGLVGFGLFFAAYSVYLHGAGRSGFRTATTLPPTHAHTTSGDFSCPAYYESKVDSAPKKAGAAAGAASVPSKPRVALVFGTRPEAIKLTSVVSALKSDSSIETVTVATGQHDTLLDTALSALSIEPDIVMKLMTPNQELTTLGAKLMEHVGCALRQIKPSVVVVQGDTITATMASLAAFMQGVPVAHVEAGLRSDLPRDPFPEEVQRVSISSMATLHFAPTQFAADRLLDSGVCGEKIAVVGNTVIDALLKLLSAPPSSAAVSQLSLLGMPTPEYSSLISALATGPNPPAQLDMQREKWVIVTMHRRENFGEPIERMIAAVKQLSTMFPQLRFVVPVHPNPNVKGAVTAGFKGSKTVTVIDAQPYDVFIHMLAAADAVLTDSGGLQEEGVALGKRLFVMRHATERPEALRSGLVNLVGTQQNSIVAHVGAWAASVTTEQKDWPPAGLELPVAEEGVSQAGRMAARTIFGDGKSGVRVATTITQFISEFGGSAAALRDFQSCRHKTYDAASLQVARAQTDHVFHDMTWHEGTMNYLAGHQRFEHRVECSAQPPNFREPSRTLAELKAMESTYKPTDPNYKEDDFAVTAIVAVYRRPQFFERFLWAMANQTHPPKEVWVTIFGSTHEDTFRQLIRAYDPQHTVFKFISGDANFKYFGRFALGMMAKTPYTIFFDDDCIPGPDLFRNVMHTMNIATGEYNGLIGMKGHGNVVEEPFTHQQPWYFSHWEYRPERTIAVDLTGGMWFLRTEWIRMMWRERPIPILGGEWETGEDFQLTYSLKKFLNLNTFLMANDWSDGRTWAHSYDYFDISASGDTTNSNALYDRAHILFGMLMKGYVPARVQDIWGEAHSQTNIAMVLNSVATAKAMAPIYHFLHTNFNESIRVLPVITVDPRAPASETRDAILKELGVTWNHRDRIVGVWDIDLAKMGSVRWRDVDVVTETQTALAGVLETIRPAVILSPFDDQTPVILGASVTAAALRIPIIGYQHPTGCLDKQVALPGMKTQPLALCIPPQQAAFAKGTFNFVANSQILVVKHVLDTLCSCQKDASSGVGAYAECPDVQQRILVSDFLAAGL